MSGIVEYGSVTLVKSNPILLLTFHIKSK